MPDNYTSQHNFIGYFAEFPESKFTSVSGGDSQSDITQQHGGGGGIHNIVGPETVSSLTLQKPYDAVKDAGLDEWNARWKEGIHQQLTLIVQQVTSEGVPTGSARTYKGCARQSYNPPDLNRGSSDTAMLEVTVQPEELQ
jgi:hypothetical protein